MTIFNTLVRSGWRVPALLLALALTAEAAAGPRVPVALAWGPGERLYAALRDGRRVAAVDPRTWTVVAGWDVPIEPVSLALADDGATFLLGGRDGRVVVFAPDAPALAAAAGPVVRELAIGRGPTRVVALPG